ILLSAARASAMVLLLDRAGCRHGHPYHAGPAVGWTAGLGFRRGAPYAVPPLTRMFCAVTQPAASLARNATTAAISAGRPSLPNALIASRLVRNCSLLPSR